VSLFHGFSKGFFSFHNFVIILTSNCRPVVVLQVLNCYVCSVLATFVTDLFFSEFIHILTFFSGPINSTNLYCRMQD
jgi:hypothetical protein